VNPPPTASPDPTPPPADPRPTRPGPSSSAPHWPALDGLRGLAVAAVIAYHLGHVPGGFLGVDLFFVLSGFLITSLLLREHTRSGRIDLRRFWERRARRLLPALAATLVAVVVAARVGLDHTRLPALRWDALTTAGYVANWRYAWAPASGYFAADPSPLRHTWSLAIEEQYYVVWPLVVVGVLALAGRRGGARARVVGAVALAGAGASTAWMALHAGDWSTDRLYLGTDTRLAAPLAGALLACLLHHRSGADGTPVPPRRGALPRWAPSALTGVAVAGLALAVAVVHAEDGWMYRGGFLGVAALAAAAVAGGVADGNGSAARLLAARPLRWVGERSYGLYLYSWPTQVVAEAQGVDGAALTALTLAVAVPVAAASYRWLEMPVRRGRSLRPGVTRTGVASGQAAALPTATARRRGRWLAPTGAVALVVVAAVVAGTVTDARPDPLTAKTEDEFEKEATRPAVTVPPGANRDGAPLRVLLVGDSVGYTLGDAVPDDLPGVASVDGRALPGCGLLVAGRRPEDLIRAGVAPDYEGCAVPVAEADRLGLEGRPDVALLVTGAWETADHERGGRTVGPGDDGWRDQIRGLLDTRIDHLGSTGAVVALWADPCARTEDKRRRQRWYREEVLAPAAEADPRAVLVDPGAVACRDGRAVTDVAGVGDPRPGDGQHWSEEGARWLWRGWLAPALRTAHDEAADGSEPPAEPPSTEPPSTEPPSTEAPAPETTEPAGPLRTLVVGDSIGFTLDFRGTAGATEAGLFLLPGAATIGCGLIREGRSFDGARDVTAECDWLSALEDERVAQGPEVVLAVWGAWEMAGASGIPGFGSGEPGEPAYDAYVLGLLRERLEAMGAGGARVVVLGVDCWPPDGETRSVERLGWWRALSRSVADEVGAAYLDPGEALCADGRPRTDLEGVGDPRPGDGAHWSEAGAQWFWRAWLGPRLHELAR